MKMKSTVSVLVRCNFAFVVLRLKGVSDNLSGIIPSSRQAGYLPARGDLDVNVVRFRVGILNVNRIDALSVVKHVLFTRTKEAHGDEERDGPLLTPSRGP